MKRLKKIRIHQEGAHALKIGCILLVLLNVFLWFYPEDKTAFYIVLPLSIILYAIVANFYRCPIRIFEGETKGTVVAPADGKVVVIEKVFEKDYFKQDRIQISIFMSPLDVHANWYPVEGTVKKVSHENGKFKKAWLPKASEDNERSTIVIETADGQQVMARQIAGAMARRIVTYATPDDACYIDEHMGFIKLGSRVDVFLPVDSEILVSLGQKTVGNQTIIARLPQKS